MGWIGIYEIHFKGTQAPDSSRVWFAIQMHRGFVFAHKNLHWNLAPGYGLKQDHVLHAFWPHGEHCSFFWHIRFRHVNPTIKSYFKKNYIKKIFNMKLWINFLPPSHGWLEKIASPTNATNTNFVNIFSVFILKDKYVCYQFEYNLQINIFQICSSLYTNRFHSVN